jgi:hypothetical protein
MNTPQPQHLFNAPAAARYIGMSESWLAKTRVYGSSLNYLKIGRRVLYAKQDLDAWLAAHKRRSTSECGAREVA